MCSHSCARVIGAKCAGAAKAGRWRRMSSGLALPTGVDVSRAAGLRPLLADSQCSRYVLGTLVVEQSKLS